MTALAFVLRYWRVIAIVLGTITLLGGAGGYVLKIKHDAYVAGHDAGKAEAEAKCEADKAAQEAANRKAMEEATKALDDLRSKLELKDLQLDDYLKALDLAADAAPDASGTCLDADGVRRLSTIG